MGTVSWQQRMAACECKQVSGQKINGTTP